MATAAPVLTAKLINIDCTEAAGVAARLWAKVDRSGGPDACWPFNGSLGRNGYGQLWCHGRLVQAPRVAWILTNGPLAQDLDTCHSCDVRYPVGCIEYRRCCNPAHLSPGTRAENLADAKSKGRAAVGARSSVRLHPEIYASGAAGRARGEGQGRAKLTNEIVLAARAAHAAGETCAALARRYGVSFPTMSKAVTGKTWVHL